MSDIYNPSIWLDSKRHCLLYLRETPANVEYVQHVDRQVLLQRMAHDNFYRNCTRDASIGVPSFVQTLLGTARNGCVITPAARFALMQVNSSTNKEATMAKIPTKAPSKAAPKKVAAKEEPLPFNTAKILNLPTGKNPDSKASAADPDNGVHAVPGGVVKTVPVALVAASAPAKKLTIAQAAALEAPVSSPNAKSLAQVINEADKASEEAKPEVATPDYLLQAQNIVAEATAQAAKMVEEAKALLEEAVKKTEEKKALDDAKAEAAKILDKAKAEVAKIKAAVAKLGGKKPRSKKTEDEKAARGARTVNEDITGRKIVQVNEPVVRGESARGALTIAIYNSPTTDEALQYQGANASFILKMVERGYIELQ